jgi:hypothetical protein
MNESGKVFDVQDFIIRQEKLAHRGNIEPFVACAFHRSVIKIESVNVDNGIHKKTQKPPFGGFVPFRRSYSGGCDSIIIKYFIFVKRDRASVK